MAIADGQLDRLLEACVAVAEFTLALLHDARRLAGVQVRQVDDGITVMERLAGYIPNTFKIASVNPSNQLPTLPGCLPWRGVSSYR